MYLLWILSLSFLNRTQASLYYIKKASICSAHMMLLPNAPLGVYSDLHFVMCDTCLPILLYLHYQLMMAHDGK
jgi:hypothetical protein